LTLFDDNMYNINSDRPWKKDIEARHT